jgi:class 3 adenylate cyclase/tetratricopeptide (TPR) repeat protein
MLSVLVLDVVDSSALSADLDPEDFDELLRRLRDLWNEVIDEHEGWMVKWTGDGLLVSFGFPTTHDNDAEYAVKAGLRMVEVTDRERQRDPNIPDIRIGIHTGLTLVNQVRVGDTVQQDLAGNTPAIATRIESIAARNSVFVSDATQRLVAGRADARSVGEHQLKGFDEPVTVHYVRAWRDRTWDESRTPLIGREHEIGRLGDAWDRSRRGHRTTAVVRGPAGIGKSRLVRELVDTIERDGHRVVTARCSELARTTALHPVARYLGDLARWQPGDPPAPLLELLEDLMGASSVAGAHRLIAAAMGAPVELDAAMSALDPARRRSLLLESIVDWIERGARAQPLCIVIEDLHWADPTTVELVALVSELDDDVPLLLVETSRPGVQLPAADPSSTTVVELGPIEPTDAARLVRELAADGLQPAVIDRIVDRSDLVPLFLTELTRAIVSHEHGTTAELELDEIPTTLHDSLMMRLHRLGDRRELACLGAVIGRTFDADLLRDAVEADSLPVVVDDLESMVAAGLLVRVDAPGQQRYTFAHALVREAAYQSVTRRTRRTWHGRIADAMASRRGVRPEYLAHHLTEAARHDEAVAQWAAAGQNDLAVGAYDEAIAHFERGLASATEVGGETAAMMELPLQLGAGLAYATRFGYQSVEAERAYRRANELAGELDTHEAFFAVLGLWAYYQVRSDPGLRTSLGERCLHLSRTTDDPAIRLEGLSALSTTLAFEGQFASALPLIAEGIELFDENPDPDMTFVMPQHPVAGFCGIGGPLAWTCGDFALADERYRRLCEFADHPIGPIGPFTAGYAHTFAAWASQLRGDAPRALDHARRAIEVASEHGFLVWLGAATPHVGAALAAMGDPTAGNDLISDGLAGWRASGSGLFVSYYEHARALALELAGDLPGALAAARAGLDHAERHAERFHVAELLRLHGRLSDQLGDPDVGDAQRRRAIEVAHRQGAVVFELRALVELTATGRGSGAERSRCAELLDRIGEEPGVLATTHLEGQLQ